MELKTYFAQDASGNIMPGATVTVYEAGTATLATGLQDEASSPLANPFTADSSAKVAFYAPDGLYDITVVGNGRTVTIRAQFVSVDGAIVLRDDLAAPGGSALVGFQQAGAGAVARTIEDDARESVRVTQFGADPTGATDSSAAIIAALAAHPHVIVTSGIYRCDQMIELNTGKTLELRGGATLRRYAATSASTDPVVWIKGASASFFGAGQGVSMVWSENRAPKGVVRLGHKDMTESHGNVTYCDLRGMTISGAITYGQTTGEPDVALYMPNPQIGGVANYFHNIHGIRVQNANIGMWLHGWANGNTISNIQGYRLGNTTLGTNKNVFIYCNGALDNAVSNVFFHGSTNSIGLLVDDFDNTAVPGGILHTVYANSWSGMVFEQGGASAVGLKSIISTGNSYYEVRANVALGNSIPSVFTDSNVLVSLNSVATGPGVFSQVTTPTANINGTATFSGVAAVTGQLSMGDAGAIYVAKKAKRVTNGADAAALSFTLSHAAQASIVRIGYIKITAAGGQRSTLTQSVATFLYGAHSLGTTSPTLGDLKSSTGDTAAFTVALTGGVLTITTTLDDIVVEVEYGFTNPGVSVT